MASDAPVVTFFFSPDSRYSYLAASQLAALQQEVGCRVDWRPVDGREIRELRGGDPFKGAPQSGQYEWDYRRYDAESWAGYYGIPFLEPRSHEIDFRLLCRAATAARRLEIAPADYAFPLCGAVYAEARWPLDRAMCVELAEERGLEVSEFEATLDDPGTDDALSAAATEARRRGAFGVPTFFVGDRLFWGNDRLPLVRHALATAR